MSDIHLHCINLIGWGISLGCFIPLKKPLLACSTDLKLVEDEVLWKIIIIKDNLCYFICLLVSNACQLIPPTPFAKKKTEIIYAYCNYLKTI